MSVASIILAYLIAFRTLRSNWSTRMIASCRIRGDPSRVECLRRGGVGRQMYHPDLLGLDGERVLDGVQRLLVEVVAQDHGDMPLGERTLHVFQTGQQVVLLLLVRPVDPSEDEH